MLVQWTSKLFLSHINNIFKVQVHFKNVWICDTLSAAYPGMEIVLLKYNPPPLHHHVSYTSISWLI